MTKEEMKNRISLALKDPMLQQGFEIICKGNAELKERNAELKGMYAHSAREAETYKQFLELKENENAELKEKVGKYQIGMFDEIEKRDRRITKAKDFLRMIIDSYNHKERFSFEKDLIEAEQFLNEVSE